MVRVAALYRVSSARQGKVKHGEEVTLPGQKAVVEEFVAKNSGWALVKTYEEHGSAYSKPLEKRPIMLDLIADAGAKRWDVLVVFKDDRISRQGFPYLQIINLLETAGIKVWDATSSKQLTLVAEGLLFRSLEGMQSLKESEKTRDRIVPRMNQLAKSGRWTGGHVSYGYDYRHILDGDGQYVVVGGKAVRELVPGEYAPVVKEMFRMYLHGAGTFRIIRWLTESKIEGPAGGLWSRKSVSNVLKNPLYAGLIAYNQGKKNRKCVGEPILTEGKHPAIVDRETWETVQELMQVKAALPPRQRDSGYALTGVLRCAECGGTIGGLKQNRTLSDGRPVEYVSYRCNTWAHHGGNCSLKNASARIVEPNFVKALSDMLDPEAPSNLLTFAALRETESREKHLAESANRDRLKQRLTVIDRALSNLQVAYLEAGTVSHTEYKEQKGVYQKEQAEIEEALALAPTMPIGQRDYKALVEMGKQLRENWEYMTTQERKTVALNITTHLGMKVFLHTDKRIEFVQAD